MAPSCGLLVTVLAVALTAGRAVAQPAPGEPSTEYWDQTVVTPTGQPARVLESPSTTFVVSSDELRRSGAPSLVELLRRVPGLDVRTITATDAQPGLRGFAYEISDRILVLVDGRTAYIDFFGGTSWEMLPVSLLDVERIEIVLGPGASVYGNKAMLGTINVITRSASLYPYLEARVDAGTPQDGRAAVRWGVIRDDWRLRVTALARRLTLYDPAGDTTSPAGGATLTATWSPSPGTEASLEAGASAGTVYMIPTGTSVREFDAALGYLRARASHGLGGLGAPWGEIGLDLVLNAGRIRSPTFPAAASGLRADYRTPYAELHHELRTRGPGGPLSVRWGAELRRNTLDSNMTSGERALWNVAGFASGEAQLGRWRLGAGLRLDESTLRPASVSPRLSVIWLPVERQQLRAAFNTGYNNPNAIHTFADFWLSPTTHVAGSPRLRPESVSYGELGWTGELTARLRGFANAFAYRFSDWISLDPAHGAPFGGGVTVPWGNNRPFTTVGGEAGLELKPTRSFSAWANYAAVHTLGSGVYPYGVDPTGSPRHKVGAGLRLAPQEGAYFDLAAQWFGPSVIARTSESPGQVFEETHLSPVVMVHARAGWTFRSGLDLSLAVANALEDRARQLPGAERPERRATATLAWYRF